MAEHITSRCVHRGRIASVHDVRCRACAGGYGGEETAMGHSIVFPRSGVFARRVGRDAVVADANQVLFFARGEAYRVSHPADGGDDCTSIHVEEGTLLEIARRHDPRAADRRERPLARQAAPSTPRAFLAQRRLRAHAAGPGPDALLIDECLLALLDGVIGAALGARPRGERRSPATAAAHRDLAEAVKVHLARAARSRPTLEETAAAVHASPYHLTRVFRRETGLPVHRYLSRLRLRAALEDLAGAGRGRGLTGVALRAGFYDHSHFANAFRREFGVPPSACRGAGPGDLAQMSKSLQV